MPGTPLGLPAQHSQRESPRWGQSLAHPCLPPQHEVLAEHPHPAQGAFTITPSLQLLWATLRAAPCTFLVWLQVWGHLPRVPKATGGSERGSSRDRHSCGGCAAAPRHRDGSSPSAFLLAAKPTAPRYLCPEQFQHCPGSHSHPCPCAQPPAHHSPVQAKPLAYF